MNARIIVFFLLVANTVALAQQPVISNISKVRGVYKQQIEISGSGFNTNPANLVVRFGSMTGTIISSTNNFIEVIIPKGSTFSSISVTNKSNGLTGYSPIPFLQVFPGDENGTLTFTDRSTFTNSTLLFDVAIADFNGDGKNDVATTKIGATATNISVYQNTSTWGTISFTEQTLDIGNPTVNIATGDVDGDGKVDIIVSRGGDTNRNQIYVLRNTSTAGAISFANAKSYFLANGYFAKTVIIRDLDLDGKAEVIVSNTFNNELTIFKNNSTPDNVNLNFTPTVITINDATTTNGLAIEDLNHDGKPDIVISQFLDNNIFIIPNESVDGNLILGDQKVLNLSGNLNNVAIADLNLDGYQDILVTMSVEGKLAIFNGIDNDFNFDSPSTFSTGGNSWGIAIADFSGNGKPDVTVSAAAGNTFTMLENTSEEDNLNLTELAIDQTLQTRSAVMGDIDGDAKPDIILTSFITNGENELLVIRNTTCIEPIARDDDKTAEVCPTQSHRFRVAPAENATFIWKEGTTEVKNSNEAFYDTDASKTTGSYSYTVTVVSESGTCSIESSPFTLTVSAGGGTIPNDPVASNGGIACIGSDTQLFSTDVVGATYSWVGPDEFTSTEQNPTISNITAQKAGIYYVIAEISPCKSAVSSTIVEVIIPPDFTIVASGDLNFCEGNNITLTVASEVGYSYQWQKDGVDIPGETSNIYTAITAGQYQALVSSVSCSLGSNLVDITTFSPPTPTFTTSSTLCINTEVSFTNTTTVEAGQTPTFSWDFGDGTISGDENPMHTYATDQDYTVTLKVDYAGQPCLGTGQQIVAIAKPEVLALVADPVGTTSFCEGDSINLEASGNFVSYLWDSNETTSIIKVKTAGKYKVTGTSASGCLTADSLDITTNPTPILTLTAEPDTIQFGLSSELLAEGAVDYVWTPEEGLDNATIENPIATPSVSSIYTVLGTDANGCFATSEIEIIVLDSGEELPVEASKAFSPNGDGIDDVWVITGIENFPDCELVIFDRSGRIVFKKLGYNNDWDGIDEQGNPLPVGAYFYTISCLDAKTGSGSISIIR